MQFCCSFATVVELMTAVARSASFAVPCRVCELDDGYRRRQQRRGYCRCDGVSVDVCLYEVKREKSQGLQLKHKRSYTPLHTHTHTSLGCVAWLSSRSVQFTFTGSATQLNLQQPFSLVYSQRATRTPVHMTCLQDEKLDSTPLHYTVRLLLLGSKRRCHLRQGPFCLCAAAKTGEKYIFGSSTKQQSLDKKTPACEPQSTRLT